MGESRNLYGIKSKRNQELIDMLGTLMERYFKEVSADNFCFEIEGIFLGWEQVEVSRVFTESTCITGFHHSLCRLPIPNITLYFGVGL